MTTPKRVRKPGNFTVRRRRRMACGHTRAWFFSVAGGTTLDASDLRRLAAWCEKAAAYLEQQRKEPRE